MRTGTPAFDKQEPLRFTIATADGSVESIATTDVPRLSLQRHLAQEGEDLIADVLSVVEESLEFLDDPERMVIDEEGYQYFGFDAAEQHFTKMHQISLGHLLQNAGLDTDTATANIRIHEDTRMLGGLWLLRFAFLRDGSEAYHEREPLFDLLENYLTQSIGIHTALLVCDDLSEVAELEETLFRLEKLRRPVRAAFTRLPMRCRLRSKGRSQEGYKRRGSDTISGRRG